VQFRLRGVVRRHAGMTGRRAGVILRRWLVLGDLPVWLRH
jgi:hypothetical protein